MKPGPGRKKDPHDGPAQKWAAPQWIWLLAILAVFAVNLLLPRSFLIFGVDHLSFLSFAFQIGWTLLALAAVLFSSRTAKLNFPGWILWALAAGAILSFFAWRTTLPGIHGDGESGGYPQYGTARIALYPGTDGRLQSFLNAGLLRLLPSTFRFDYRSNSVFEDYPLNSSWILLTILCGTALAVVTTALVSRWRADTASRTGLLGVVLFSAPFLNAYGHFDSYIVPVLCSAVWAGAMAYAAAQPRRLIRWLGAGAAAAAAAWAHPILMVLGVYTALFLFGTWMVKRSGFIPRGSILAAGFLIALLPYAIGRGNWDFFRSGNAGLTWWLLHEKAMSCLAVAMPAILLGASVVWQHRRALQRPAPLPALAMVMLVSAPLLFLTQWVGYGLRDEFLYSLLGAICLGGVVLLIISLPPDAPFLLAAATFSLFLYLPKAWVYSGPLLYDRFTRHMLHDRCSAARKFSGYFLAATATPTDTPAYRERMLALLNEGFTAPVAEWDTAGYRQTCRAHYTAWCLEFGKDRAATRQLEWFLANSPDVLPTLWRGNGRAFRTDHFLNRSPQRARELSRPLLAKYRSATPHPEFLDALWRSLECVDADDPVRRYVPRPGTLSSDLDMRLGESRNAFAEDN